MEIVLPFSSRVVSVHGFPSSNRLSGGIEENKITSTLWKKAKGLRRSSGFAFNNEKIKIRSAILESNVRLWVFNEQLFVLQKTIQQLCFSALIPSTTLTGSLLSSLPGNVAVPLSTAAESQLKDYRERVGTTEWWFCCLPQTTNMKQVALLSITTHYLVSPGGRVPLLGLLTRLKSGFQIN